MSSYSPLLNVLVVGTFTALTLCFPEPSRGQDLSALMQQNMAVNQQFNARLGAMMMQNQLAQQQLMQQYISQYGPQLRSEYAQFIKTTGMQVPFEYFVWTHMMTAGGTNAGPALDAQRRNFQALQGANRAMQQGNDSYNQGYWNNSRTTEMVNRNYSQGYRGETDYRNPNTGQVFEDMPHAAQPGTYTSPEGNFYKDPSGNYHQVDPLGYMQELEEVE